MPIDPVIYNYICTEARYPANAVIVEEGAKGDWVYVVLEGQVKVKKKTPKGFVVIDTLSEGDIFGEVAFLEGEGAGRSATVLAAEGSVRIGILDKEQLIKEYSLMSPTLKAIMRSLPIKVRETTQKICAALVAGK
jgi:CRP-like cAMP-binding protein